MSDGIDLGALWQNLDDPDALLDDLEEGLRFSGIVEQAQDRGDVGEKVDPATLSTGDLEELEARALDLARIDPACFIQYVFQWPMQKCHCEWQDHLDAHDRVVLWAPIEHGKSSQISIARPLFELGKNPNLRVVIISNTGGQASKFLGVIKQQIMLNPRMKAVFPGLRKETRRDRKSAWYEDSIIVERDDLDNKDMSIQALGTLGAIIGARVDIAILDDVLDFENTLHATSRKRAIEWFDSSVESRISPFGKIWGIGTAWHREDLMHNLASRPGWRSHRYDAWEGELWPELVNVGGKWCGWPKWRLEQKRQSIPAIEFARQFRNRPLSQALEIFNTSSIEQCYGNYPWNPDPTPDQEVYVGVDLNVKKRTASDQTVFFIGEARPDGMRRVLNIVHETMNLRDIVRRFFEIERRYSPVIFLVENNAAQDYVCQYFEPDTLRELFLLQGIDPTEYIQLLPRVEGFHTGVNKADPELGIRGMTVEFEQKRWQIPRHESTAKWVDQMVGFDPAGHTGDILMASWFFHSATRKFRKRHIRAASIGGPRHERDGKPQTENQRLRILGR